MPLDARRQSTRRKLFAPQPPLQPLNTATASTHVATNKTIDPSLTATPITTDSNSAQMLTTETVETDAALAIQLAAAENAQTNPPRYSLRRRNYGSNSTQTKETIESNGQSSSVSPSSSSSTRRSVQREQSSDDDSLSSLSEEQETKKPIRLSQRPKDTSKSTAGSSSNPFQLSLRKKQKPIKIEFEESENPPEPPRWRELYELLIKQRSQITAPVDTMGCDENGRPDRRADKWRERESEEKEAKRERFTTLISLMLSSQTKDAVTAEAVYQLQTKLPDGLTVTSLSEASDELISSCIQKVGFWRRKTGYIKSVARILLSDFQEDVPQTVDELCSLPGVGPKMAFLALGSMGIQIGIGVDTHVHRLTNRFGWHQTKVPEKTRLSLQSWLPKELHGSINKVLVGFGQMICLPIGPKCNLCTIGEAGLCPSYRKVDSKPPPPIINHSLSSNGFLSKKEISKTTTSSASFKGKLDTKESDSNKSTVEIKQEDTKKEEIVSHLLDW